MDDFISREAEIQFFNDWVDDLDKQINDSVNCPHLRSDYKVCKTQLLDCIHAIKEMPAADVVSRDCYDRILAENDTMREQLAQIGKKPGDSMDDVRPVVLCRDCVYYNTTGCADGFGWCEGVMVSKGTSDDFFCAEGKQNPYECGADMRPYKDGRRGEKEGG